MARVGDNVEERRLLVSQLARNETHQATISLRQRRSGSRWLCRHIYTHTLLNEQQVWIGTSRQALQAERSGPISAPVCLFRRVEARANAFSLELARAKTVTAAANCQLGRQRDSVL